MKYLIACILLYTLRAATSYAQARPFQDPEGILWGIKQGSRIVLAPAYEYIAPFNPYGLAVFRKNGFYGITDTSGRERIPARYTFISYAGDTTFIAQKTNDGGETATLLLDQQGRERSTDSVRFQGLPQGNYFYVFRPHARNADNHGIIDRQGRLVVPMEYRHIDILDGSFIVQNARGYRLFRDGKNIDTGVEFESLRPLAASSHRFPPVPRFEAGGHSRDHFLVYESNGMAGLMDVYGNVLCAPIYYDIQPFSDGLARVRRKDGYGFVDSSGQEVIPAIYEQACGFSGGFAVVQKDGKTGLLHCSGREILAPVYNDIPGRHVRPGVPGIIPYTDIPGPLFTGLARAVHPDPLPEMPWEMRHAEPVSEGRIAFCTDSACGYADTAGRIVIPPVYQSVAAFHEGRAAVQQDGKWGYIDTEGRIVIPCIYDLCEDFGAGYTLVKKNGEQALIGRDGNIRTPFCRKMHTRIGDTLVRIYANRRMYILKTTGGITVVKRHTYTSPCADSRHHHIVKRRKYGIVSTEGEIVLPLRYTYIDEHLPGFFTVARGRGRHKKYGLYSKDGKEVLPPLSDKPPVLCEGIISTTSRGISQTWNLCGKPIREGIK